MGVRFRPVKRDPNDQAGGQIFLFGYTIGRLV
jgi:hypothetical protein